MPLNTEVGCSRPAAEFDCAVVIPLYNKGPYIERALASVAAQSPRPKAIIVIDDGSTDDGPDRVAARARLDPSIELIRQSNAGVSAARNRGILAAQSEWVAFLDADDAYLPWFTAEMAMLVALCPDAHLLGASFEEVEPGFSPARLAAEATTGRQATLDVVRGPVTQFYDRWWRGSIFFTSSICARRHALAALGTPFPESERHGEDLDLFFRLVEAGPIAWTSRVCALYAIGVAGSLTSGGIAAEPVPAYRRLLARIDLPAFAPAERGGARRCLATHWMTIARGNIGRGNVAAAWDLLRHPITMHRPLYWLRTAGMLAASVAGRGIGQRATAATGSLRKGNR